MLQGKDLCACFGPPMPTVESFDHSTPSQPKNGSLTKQRLLRKPQSHVDDPTSQRQAKLKPCMHHHAPFSSIAPSKYQPASNRCAPPGKLRTALELRLRSLGHVFSQHTATTNKSRRASWACMLKDPVENASQRVLFHVRPHRGKTQIESKARVK